MWHPLFITFVVQQLLETPALQPCFAHQFLDLVLRNESVNLKMYSNRSSFDVMKILWTSASACAPTRARQHAFWFNHLLFFPYNGPGGEGQTWGPATCGYQRTSSNPEWFPAVIFPRLREGVHVSAQKWFICALIVACFHEVVRKILHFSILCTGYKISFKIWDKICTIYTLANESLPRQSKTATLLLRKALSCQIPNFASKSRSFHRTLFRRMRDNGRECKLIYRMKQRVHICI